MSSHEEAVYCAMKHFASFYQQAMVEKKADFGEPCINCKLYAGCNCEWLSKVSEIIPDDIEINVGQVRNEKIQELQNFCNKSKKNTAIILRFIEISAITILTVTIAGLAYYLQP